MSNNPSFEQSGLAIKEIVAKLYVVGDTADNTAIYGYCSNIPGVEVYCERDGKTISDTGTGWTTGNAGSFDNDGSAGIVGVLAKVGDAAELISVDLLKFGDAVAVTLESGSSLGTLATITCTKASTDGLTASYNIAFLCQLNSLDLDSAVGVHSFFLKIKYRARTPA
jgi:hypothetical protein